MTNRKTSMSMCKLTTQRISSFSFSAFQDQGGEGNNTEIPKPDPRGISLPRNFLEFKRASSYVRKKLDLVFSLPKVKQDQFNNYG